MPPPPHKKMRAETNMKYIYPHSSHLSSQQLREDQLLIREVLQVKVRQHPSKQEVDKSQAEHTYVRGKFHLQGIIH